MTMHHRPQPPEPPLTRWGSREIADFIRRARPTGPLPEPGRNAMPLLLDARPVMTMTTEIPAPDWTGTAACNHRRDAGVQMIRATLRADELDRNQKRIIRILAALDTRQMPDGSTLRLCVNRRRLKASAEAMQNLYRAGLVNGAGSRDAWGTGNTADTSWWWLSSEGIKVAKQLADGPDHG